MLCLHLLTIFLALCAGQSVTNECPYGGEIHHLPVSTKGIWRENRQRFVSLAAPSLGPSTLIVLTGDHELSRYPFRQNSNFYYLTGANMPGYYVSIYVTATNPLVATLFVPPPSADYAVWNGHVYSKAQLRQMYDVDAVLYTNETNNYVSQFPASTPLYTITSSVALPPAFTGFTSVNRAVLPSIMTTSRATKSDKEIILMQVVNKISSFAHVNAMQFVASRMNLTNLNNTINNTKNFPNFKAMFNGGNRVHLAADTTSLHVPMDDVALSALETLTFDFSQTPLFYETIGAAQSLYEYEVESLFIYHCGLCGAMQQAYLPIVGAGNNGAILHYIANNKVIVDGDMLLIDAGTEYWGYGSDITRTYPVNGVFSAQQTLIYNIVLQAQEDVVAVVKAGVTWSTLNTIARESITKNLLQAGLLRGTLIELMNNNVYNIFYPHGIGHSVGLDVHDSQTSIITANQVITVEPGVYFNAYLLDQARSSTRARFIVWEEVDNFRGTGGVRIEDDYVVTTTGCTRITEVPSGIAEIEKIMSIPQ